MVELAYLFAFVSQLHFERGVFMLYLEHKGFAISDIAVLQIVLMTTNVVVDVPAGRLADYVGRPVMLIYGCLLLASSAWAMSASSSYWQFCLVFGVEGAGFALISGADQAFLFEVDRRGQALAYSRRLSLYQAASTAGLAVAVSLGGLIAARSYRYTFDSAATAMLIGAVVAAGLWVLQKYRSDNCEAVIKPVAGRSGKAPLPEIKVRRSAAIVASFANACFLLTAGPLYVFSQHILFSLHMTLAQIGVITAVVTSIEALAYVAIRSLLAPGQFKLCSVCAMGSVVLLLAASISPTSMFGVAWGSIGILAAVTLVITTSSVQVVIGDKRRGMMLSALSAFDTLAIIAGNAFFGYLLSNCSIRMTLAILSLPPLVSGIAYGLSSYISSHHFAKSFTATGS